MDSVDSDQTKVLPDLSLLTHSQSVGFLMLPAELSVSVGRVLDIFHAFLSSADFFKINFYEKILTGIPS